jgi:hypothetical protein
VARDGGLPAGGTAAGQPPDYAQALAQFDIEGNANQSDPEADGILNYWTDLPDGGFIADPDTTYWIEIQPIFTFPPQWAWEATVGGQGSDAVHGFDFLDIQFWTNPDPTNDVAFQLTGTPLIPGPGALALLAVAAGLSGFRRRRR